MQGKLLDSIGFLKEFDPALGGMIEREFARQRDGLELIASENYASPAVIAAMGSILTNKYAEGIPGDRHYGGCQFIDEMEMLCIDRAKALFGAQCANVQPHSGSQANAAVELAILQPGDTMMGMDPGCGGHMTHGDATNYSGTYYNVVSYGVDPKTGLLDYDQVRDLAKKKQPKLLIAGASAYPREIDFEIFADIAHETGAVFMVDMAHIAGLVAGGVHKNPVPYADIVTTTTHKTLRGPRGGLILCKEEFIDRINNAVFPGIQGGPLEHIIAAKAVCFREAAEESFKDYTRNVVSNAKALANALADEGFHIVTGGTDNHMVLADLQSFGISGHELQNRMDANNITLNGLYLPGSPTGGIRVGTPAVTTRGMREAEMERIARCIALTARDFAGTAREVRATVRSLSEEFPLY